MKTFSKLVFCLLCALCCTNQVCMAQKLNKAFDRVTRLDGFQMAPHTAQEYGYPKEVGDMKMACYGNAEPRDKVLKILSAVPKQLLVFEHNSEKGEITRYYLEQGKDGTAYLMKVFIGRGGNDLCLWLFTGASYEYYQSLIQQVKEKY